jgi:hypothetical protein
MLSHGKTKVSLELRVSTGDILNTGPSVTADRNLTLNVYHHKNPIRLHFRKELNRKVII